MTIPKLTDEAVSELPLVAGRAELLEEIVSTAATDRQTTEPSTLPTRRRGWLVPAAAAAVVAGIAVSSLWWQLVGDDEDGSPSVAASLDLPNGQGVVLDTPGWTVESLGSDGIQFRKGSAELEVTSYDAKDYDSYVEDRAHIVDPPAAGAPIEVLGRPAQTWAYTARDHTAIREVEDGHWLELRGDGMDQATYLQVLGQLRLTTQVEFEASLPNGYVTEGERPVAAAQVIKGIRSVSHADFPSGVTISFDEGDSEDRYQFGAEVAGAYACAWLGEFSTATEAGDSGRSAEAARVLGTSRQWPILQQMNDRGDYPEVVWEYADDVAAGRVPEGYQGGLGC